MLFSTLNMHKNNNLIYTWSSKNLGTFFSFVLPRKKKQERSSLKLLQRHIICLTIACFSYAFIST